MEKISLMKNTIQMDITEATTQSIFPKGGWNKPWFQILTKEVNNGEKNSYPDIWNVWFNK